MSRYAANDVTTEEFLTLWFNEEHGGPAVNPQSLTGDKYGPYAGLNNPFDTTLVTKGSTTLKGNSAGVQNYPSAAEGIAATVATLNEKQYAGLRAALQNPNSTLAQLQKAEASSPWGNAFAHPSNTVPAGSFTSSEAASMYVGIQSGTNLPPGFDTSLGAFAGNLLYGSTVAPAKSAASALQNGILGPVESFVAQLFGQLIFIGLGIALVIVGLVVTFKDTDAGQEAEHAGKDAVVAGAA